MRDIFPSIKSWISEDQQVALATVVSTWGSSPRAVGAKMAVNQAGEMTGSVSGGCVEGAVAEACQESLKSGQPALIHYGVADDTAWEVGLACGGEIEVFVQPLEPEIYHAIKQAVKEDRSLALVTVIGGSTELMGTTMAVNESGTPTGNIAHSHYDRILELANQALQAGNCMRQKLADDLEIFIDVVLPPPRLIVVGGVHIAVALVKLAKVIGYQTIVVDPRRQFGSQSRFPAVDQLVQQWPDQALEELGITSNTAVVVLTHDPKLDDPGLMVALPSQAFYVGALGSRKTNAKRQARLLEAGMDENILDRLHAPVGLDLGGRSPEEIALAIMAEIVQARNK